MYHLLSTEKTNRKNYTLFFGILLVSLFLIKSPAASAACTYPAEILNLASYKQTLPTGKSGSPTEILQPALGSYVSDPYFKTNATCDGVVFQAPVNGVTTSNSGYPRSELREMTNNGKDKASWSTTSGTHTMYIDEAITAVPKDKKHVVAGQIHDADDDVVVIRLEYPKLFVDINGKTGPILDANYTLGKRFTVKFVAENGKIKIYYNGSNDPIYTLNKSTSGCYFKAGAYTQSNCSKESDCSSDNFGEVIIYNLSLNGEVVVPKPNDVESVATASEEVSAELETTAEEDFTVETTSPKVIPTDTLFFEAEAGEIGEPLQIVSDSEASGGNYIVQTTNKGGKGIAKYKVNIPSTGRYQLRARVISPSGSSNSFYYKLGSDSFKTWSFPKKTNDWTWVDGKSIELTEGEHVLEIKKREKNTQLDVLELRSMILEEEIITTNPETTKDSVIMDNIFFEAEDGVLTEPMQIISDSKASAGKYIVQTNDKGEGSAKYKFSISVAGEYQLYANVISPSGSSNSFYYKLDQESSRTWSLPDNIKDWTWVDGKSIELTEGEHILEIKKREKNTQLDALELRPINPSKKIFTYGQDFSFIDGFYSLIDKSREIGTMINQVILSK